MYTLKSKWSKLQSRNRLYSVDIPIIGLTGGIATGKSTVSDLLRKEQIPVIDADQLIKTAYALPDILSILKSNSTSFVNDQDQVNFPILREAFFNDAALKEQLEKSLYEKLPMLFKKELSLFNNPSFVVYDVPLLFEKELQDKLDVSVTVYAPRNTQLQRMIKRDNIDEELGNKILESQMDIEDKLTNSDLVIKNTADHLHLDQEFQSLKSSLFN